MNWFKFLICKVFGHKLNWAEPIRALVGVACIRVVCRRCGKIEAYQNFETKAKRKPK